MQVGLRFGILGRLEVYADDGGVLDIGGAQPRLIAAALVAADARVLTSDFLIDAIWGDRPPASPAGALQTYISRLRRHLGSQALVWEPPGYRLVVERGGVDAWRFEQLATDGREALEAGDPERARRLLRDAERLWRGAPLPELVDVDHFRGLTSRLEDRRLVAAEDRFHAELALGRHELVAGELAEAVTAHPYREGLRAQLALALYRSGRQAEALRSISGARTTFAEELGIDPGAELTRLEAAILAHDPSLDLASQPPARREPRSARIPAVWPTAATLSTLVGRRRELGILSAAHEDARGGHAMVLVEGPPGIGKTRMVEEFADSASDAGARVLWGSCYEGAAAPSWWPWLAVLEGLVAATPEADSPELQELLHPSAGDEDDNGQRVSPSRRFQLHEAVRRALALPAAAGPAPLIVVLDDWQWADEASLELLAHLTRTLGDVPLLTIVILRELEIGRSDSLTHVLGLLARHPATRRIHLRGLSGTELAELLRQGFGIEAPAEVGAAINARAEGNPFFAIELARDLQERGVATAEQLAAGAVPAGVADVVRQRLDRLPPATRQLLQVAAVIGRDVDSSLLVHAAGRGTDIYDDLEPAFAHRFLEHVSDGWPSFRFTHALVREVLISEITPLREARLHLDIADAIEARGELSGIDAEILAEHLYAARSLGVGGRAAVALRSAAAIAIRRSAYAAAEDMLSRSAVLLRTADDVDDRANTELDVLVALFFAQRATRGHDVALSRAPYRRARELAASIGRIDVTARLLWAEWVGVDKARDVARSRELSDELRRIAAESGETLIEGLSLHASGVLHWHAGELTQSAADLDRAAQLNRTWASTAKASVQAMVAPVSPSAWPRGHPVVTFIHVLIGDVDDPLGQFQKTAADDMQPFGSTVVWMFAAFGALAIGEIDVAIECGRNGLEADPDLVFTYWGPGAHMALGAALVARGDIDEGLEIVARAMPRYLASGTRIFVPLVHARVAQGLARAGRREEADVQLGRAVTLTAEYAERWLEPVVDAVAAEIEMLRGGWSDAVRTRLVEAEVQARSQGAGAIADGITALAKRLCPRAERCPPA